MKKSLLALVLASVLALGTILSALPAVAQNTICPTAAPGDSSNKCASTAFVQNALVSSILYTAITGLPPNTVLGSLSGGNAAALTPVQLTTLCNVFSTTLSGCVPSPVTVSGRYLGDDHAWHAVPVQTIIAGSGISLSGTCSGTALNCTVAAPASTQLVLASRAFAITQNLSALTAVQTLGYATSGDGGGATFKNVGAAAFKDTYITSATLTGGSGYVNANYLGVIMTGGTGVMCEAAVTVSGGAVTALNIAIPCAGFSVGDVLTAPNSFFGGTGSGFKYTVTAISTPQASFTDASGAHFQFVINGTPASLTQFGAKGDWAGTDATATNNSPALWSAAAWASIFSLPSTTLSYGQQVFIPHGSYMTCGTVDFSTGPIIFYVPIPQNVRLVGSGPDDTALKECAADTNRHYIELCDTNAQVGQFGCAVENMSINLSAVTSVGTTAAIYSNSGQQFPLGVRLHILAGNRSCILYEVGKGGAANDIWYNIDCNQAGVATSNPAFSFNASSTQHVVRDSVIENGSSSSVGISNLNGRLLVDGLDIEGFGQGLVQNVGNVGNVSVYRNVQQNSNNCVAAISLLSGNVPGNILFENVISTCPVTINNGQTSGVSFTGNIIKPITCPSNCS